MHSTDLIKRLYHCKKIETSLQLEEEIFQKAFAKYCRELNKAETVKNCEIASRDANRRKLQALQKTNKKLKMILQQEEKRIKKNTHLQEEYEKQIIKLADETMRNCIKKEFTRSYLNTRSLPHAAQGMNVNQGRFVPFNIPTDQFNISKVPAGFWNHAEKHNVYSNRWDDLVFDRIR